MHTAYFLSRTFTDNNDRKKQQQQDASTSQADGMETLAIEDMECKLELQNLTRVADQKFGQKLELPKQTVSCKP